MRRTVGVIAVVVLASTLAASGDAAFPGANGKLFFAAREPGTTTDRRVYSVAPDGSELTELTTTGGDAESLTVAPRGGPIVAARDTHDQCGHLYWAAGVDLFSAAQDGSGQAQLTDNCPVSDETPAFSPSGQHLVFSRFGELWSMQPDGSDLAQLTCVQRDGQRQEGGDFWPNWSPDGSLIAFDHFESIAVMDANGDDIRVITTGSAPSFSPDGTEIAYSRQGIHIVSVDGTHDVQLTSGDDYNPVWSPDGTRIAFIHAGTIETMNADGSSVSTVVDSLVVSALDWATPSAQLGSEPDVTAADTTCPETTLGASEPAAGVPTAPATTVSRAGLNIAAVSFLPKVLRSRRPLTLTVALRDSTGLPVSGALVRATARGNAALAAAGTTNAAGVIRLRVVPTRRLVLAPGRRLVLQVTADTPAATATRLVSVRTSKR